jgi:hypothetical protein
VLLDEFLECTTVSPDYINVNIHGAPPIHIFYQEVGLKESEFDRVGRRTGNNVLRPFDALQVWGSSQVRWRIDGNPVREVGTAEFRLPAA